MPRRPLLVGALVVIVGVALVLLWVQSDTDPVAQGPTPTSAASSPTGASPTPSPATPTPTAPLATSTAEPPPPPPTPQETGPELRIPGIDLRSGLHAEGLREGKINPPSGTVMWFTGFDRVAPGEVGTSVIAGHVVSRGSPDAFADLAQVSVGDQVEIIEADGTVETYRVVRAGVVDKDELTTDQTVWGANSTTRRLAIITCDDAYGFRSDGHRVANYVVIAEPV